MRDRPSRRILLAGVALAVAALLHPATATFAKQQTAKQAMRFAADMAQSGNWREAAYRWELALEREPENPRVLNNLAVASEVLGEIARARDYYERAMALSGGDDRIRDNRNRFLTRPGGTTGPGRRGRNRRHGAAEAGDGDGGQPERRFDEGGQAPERVGGHSPAAEAAAGGRGQRAGSELQGPRELDAGRPAGNRAVYAQRVPQAHRARSSGVIPPPADPGADDRGSAGQP